MITAYSPNKPGVRSYKNGSNNVALKDAAASTDGSLADSGPIGRYRAGTMPASRVHPKLSHNLLELVAGKLQPQ
jgi:hypothetical protein